MYLKQILPAHCSRKGKEKSKQIKFAIPVYSAKLKEIIRVNNEGLYDRIAIGNVYETSMGFLSPWNL